MKVPKQRFKILKFVNLRSGTISWRVSGIKRNGERIRENFADAQEAQYRYTEVEGDYHAACRQDQMQGPGGRRYLNRGWGGVSFHHRHTQGSMQPVPHDELAGSLGANLAGFRAEFPR